MLMQTREILVCENKVLVAEVPLAGGRAEGRVALVSPAKWELIERYGPWYYKVPGNDRHGYVFGHKRDKIRTSVFLHSMLLGFPPVTRGGDQIDHLDHNELNNFMENLALVSIRCSNMNRLRFRTSRSGQEVINPFSGVRKKGRRWSAEIKNGRGQNIGLGRYDDPEEAAEAYDAAKRKEAVVLGCPRITVNRPQPGETNIKTGEYVCPFSSAV